MSTQVTDAVCSSEGATPFDASLLRLVHFICRIFWITSAGICVFKSWKQ